MKPWDKTHFLSLPEKLGALNESAKPLWGSMTAQHMVEHLVGSWRISNGRGRAKAFMSKEETEKRRAFMFSDEPYPKNLFNPMFANGLPPLRKSSLADAIAQLDAEMTAFFEYHEENPEAVEVHPVYGDLDFDGWMLFQTKHMGHHLAQFGL